MSIRNYLRYSGHYVLTSEEQLQQGVNCLAAMRHSTSFQACIVDHEFTRTGNKIEIPSSAVQINGRWEFPCCRESRTISVSEFIWEFGNKNVWCQRMSRAEFAERERKLELELLQDEIQRQQRRANTPRHDPDEAARLRRLIANTPVYHPLDDGVGSRWR